MRYKLIFSVFLVSVFAVFVSSCRSTKFVPDDEYLLASAVVKADTKAISSMEMENYIKQKPNFKTFAIFKLPLSIYNLSGRDSTKWVNRTLRNAGEPPVIYDSTMVDQTVINLHRIMINKGYLNAEITPLIKLHKKRASITYDIKAGEPYRINDYIIDVNDTILSNSALRLSTTRRNNRPNESRYANRPALDIDTILYRNTLVKKNATFDLDVLDQERARITSLFRRTGYYAFNKEHIGFDADTTDLHHRVNLDLVIYPYVQRGQNGQISERPHQQYIVKEVELYVDFNPLDGDISQYPVTSVYEKDGYKIYYGSRGQYIKPHAVLNNCFIRPGELYNENFTIQTYNSLSQLRILKNVNISYIEISENDSTKLRCRITCVPEKRQGIQVEAEGTNSGGFFGVGASLGYLHRNAFRGSELFNVKLRGIYEAITPNFSTFRDNYFEIGGETSLTFPRFMFPFFDNEFKRRIHASTQLTANYTYQRRPGYFTRTVSAAGVKYIWQNNRRQTFDRHTLDLIEISYAHVPIGSLGTKFYENLSEAARRYSFSDQFIMSAGYTFTRTNAGATNRRNRPIYSFRASIESAGNVLDLVSRMANIQPDSVGSRKIFGINFAQYLRGMVDYSKTYIVDEKNSIAWHVGGGLAYPYGNFHQIPIQKRFFSGGANSVRGWGIRELGPGSYYFHSTKPNDKDNFYYHSGDIRFDANIEYRSKLFWILELGAFIDAGNIWTMREYEGQEGGEFKFNKFYKQIAMSWGLGFRFDFDFVLVRLDAGWKAYDPSGDPNVTRWPIKDPLNFRKNTAWHIAVGYPF